MNNNDTSLLGLYVDEQFMDHLYRYGEIKNEIESKKQDGPTVISKEMEKDIEKCGMHRVASVNICLSKIKSLAQGSEEWGTYFNYVRWNHDVISDELQLYLQQSSMEKHRGTILACRQLMDYVLDELCKFSVADESIISEYKHIYCMISHPRQPKKKVLLQAGRLFVNFVDILTKRFYYKEGATIKFADVEMEAGVIIDKLYSKCRKLADTVKSVHENFIELRKMQDVYHVIQKDLLKKALKLAHVRATESILQAAKRILSDAISMVRQKLRDGLRTAIKIGEALIYPVMHPVETAKSMWYALRHPLKSAKALIAWAKENPWKCAAIIAGGLCLGAVVLGGSAVLIDYFIVEITSTILTPLLVGGACGGIITPLSVAANRARSLLESADGQVVGLKSGFNSFERKLDEQGEDIAIQALNEDWWYLLDEEEKTPSAAPTTQQIDTMSEDELRQVERELKDEYLPAIEESLSDNHIVMEETIRDMSPDQQEASVIHKASEILKRRIAATSGRDNPKN